MSQKSESGCCGAGSATGKPGPTLAMAGGCECPDPAPKTLPVAEPCCPPAGGLGRELPGYRLWGFVEGWLDTPAGPVPRVKSALDAGDVLGRWQMRWGIGRDRYRIAPGLYAVGFPDRDAPVLVTANYKMTFDLLRRDVAGLDVWVLVLDTRGINVWCAAGKGTFGTAEVVRRVKASGLDRVVRHRRLVLPQLGAPGVSAHEVRKGCGFAVRYGPVRSADLPRFLADGMEATPEMRAVTFTTLERLVLTPVELVMMLKPAAWAALALFLVAGLGPGFFSFSAAWHRGLAGLQVLAAALLTGAVAVPVLLPWLPGRSFSVKGMLAGAAVAVLAGFGTDAALGHAGFLALFLALSAGASYVAMNFTGATPFTSPSGVEREMRDALPWQAGAGALAGLLWVVSAF